jgi:hypothetical protein
MSIETNRDFIYTDALHKAENSNRLIKLYISHKDLNAAITEAELLLNRLNILYEKLEK